jgi:dihydrofolate synthase / folylpolyglutamate synthase
LINNMVKMPHWPVPLWYKPIDLGLERIRALLAKLGNPHMVLPPVVHVAGTNGKGSTLAFLRAFLEESGYTVHCYTSPHLVRFNERIHISGREITDGELYEILEECRIATEALDLPITFFEGTTAAAFLAFSRYPADIVLLETGLGGRLDATNLIDHPAATIITPISLDHMAYLGDTIAKIAAEKAAIMKRGTPCILSMQTAEAEAVCEATADAIGAPLIAYGYDWGVTPTASGFTYASPDKAFSLPLPALAGEHQLVNAGAAITAALSLKDFTISDEAIQRGLQSVRWPARLQHLTEGRLAQMLPAGWELWVDGAHNEAGGYMLSLWAETKQDRPLYLISGMTQGRDSVKFFEPLASKADFMCGLLVESEASSQTAEYVTAAAEKAGLKAKVCDSLEEALRYTCSLSGTPARILVCGSLYLAGTVLEMNGN